MRRFLSLCFALSIFLNQTNCRAGNTLKIQVDGLRNNNGHVVALLFNTKKGYPDKVQHALQHAIVPINQHAAELTFSLLPVGQFVVSVFHDENQDRRLNRGLFGRPLEGVGVSNNIRGRFGPPKYENCIIQLNSPEQTIAISLHYRDQH